MNYLRVIIAGGRDFTNASVMATVLNNLQDVDHAIEIEKLTLICGMAQGADITAYNLFKGAGLPIEEYPAKWKDLEVPNAVIKYNRNGAYNALAGYARNIEMAQNADMLIAFWDGSSSGTKHMITTARKHNLNVLVFNYEGTPL